MQPTKKKVATRKVAFSSTTGDSVTKHRQESADFGSFAGGTDRENTETSSTGSTVMRKEDFYICPTPGCVQRKKNRWGARRWELKNDPDLDDSLENQNQEIERIDDEEEERHRRQTGKFSDKDHSDKRRELGGDEKRHRQREENEYHDAKNMNETKSSRQSARNSTRQSGNRSRDSGTRSRQYDEQTTANGWVADDSTQSDEQTSASGWMADVSAQPGQQTIADGWGATDADRTSNRTRTNRDVFRGDVETHTSTTQTGNDVFADNVYDEETATDDETATKRDAFQDATDPESLDDDNTETHNHSWSQSRDRR